MTSKKRPFREGDIVFVKYNGHAAITRLSSVDGGRLKPDNDTALAYVNEESNLSKTLPETIEEENTSLCDAPGQFKYYKNLCKVYATLCEKYKESSALNRALQKENDDLRSIVERKQETNSYLAAQLDAANRKIDREKRKSLWERIFGAE